jgi:glycine cleavage system H lipoate-binding protein
MLPGIYEFSWDTGHVLFLGIFYSVLAVVASSVIIASLRVLRHLRQERLDALRWHCDFEDLPPAARSCRHAISGEAPGRVCVKGFECYRCAEHFDYVAARNGQPVAMDDDLVGGFALPAGRLYHRGHTWVRTEEDGTVTVGLDDLGAHLLGKPDKLVLPPVGTRLAANGAGWMARRNEALVRIMSPVDGIVTAHGEKSDDWILRIMPDAGASLAHLLELAEARPWMLKEVERLHGLVATEGVGATLPDGGVPIDDFADAIPPERYDEVCGLIFLEP